MVGMNDGEGGAGGGCMGMGLSTRMQKQIGISNS